MAIELLPRVRFFVLISRIVTGGTHLRGSEQGCGCELCLNRIFEPCYDLLVEPGQDFGHVRVPPCLRSFIRVLGGSEAVSELGALQQLSRGVGLDSRFVRTLPRAVACARLFVVDTARAPAGVASGGIKTRLGHMLRVDRGRFVLQDFCGNLVSDAAKIAELVDPTLHLLRAIQAASRKRCARLGVVVTSRMCVARFVLCWAPMRRLLSGLVLTSACLVENPDWLAPPTQAETTSSFGSSTGLATSVGSSAPMSPSAGSDGTMGTMGTMGTSDSGGIVTEPMLLVWLPFNVPIDGSIIEDTSGNGLVATCTACPTHEVAEEPTGYEFSQGDYLEVSDAPLLRSPVLSVSIWVKRPQATVCGLVVGKAVGMASDNSWALRSCPEGYVFGVSANGVERPVTFLTEAIGSWDHIVASHDGVETVIYFNGERVAVLGEFVVPDYDDHALLVGADFDDDVIGEFFVGSLQDLRVFNYALSVEAVQDLLDAGL